MNRNLIITAILLLLMSGTALAQQRWQADIRVLSVNVTQVGGQLHATIKVYSDHDDTARHATLRVLLPVEAQFISSSNDQCTASLLWGSQITHGVAECHLGDIDVGDSRTIEIITTVPPSGWGISKTFGAFVWSLTPDPKPANNYGEGTAP